MKMMTQKLTSLAALFVLSAGLVAAQFQDLPECGRTCASTASGNSAPCAASDMRCLCNSNTFVDAVYECLGGGCDFADQNSSIGHLGELCDAANAAPPASSTTPGSTTTGAVSTSTTPGASTTPSTTSPGASGTTSTSTPSTPATSSTPTTSATRAFTTSAAAAGGASTTAAPRAGSQSTSTTVVVKTVGAEGDAQGAADQTGATSQGGNILNGASGTRADFGAIVVSALLGALVLGL